MYHDAVIYVSWYSYLNKISWLPLNTDSLKSTFKIFLFHWFYTHTHTHTHTHQHTHTHTHTHTHIYIYIYIYIYISMYVCMYVCLFVSVCVCFEKFLTFSLFSCVPSFVSICFLGIYAVIVIFFVYFYPFFKAFLCFFSFLSFCFLFVSEIISLFGVQSSWWRVFHITTMEEGYFSFWLSFALSQTMSQRLLLSWCRLRCYAFSKG